jgi:hypothetical protein
LFLFSTDSPRLYTSSNPWKISATFHTISSTREEYIATIESLKASAPSEPKKGQKRSKLEHSHVALIATLENRIEAIDAELNVSIFFPFFLQRICWFVEYIPDYFIFLMFLLDYFYAENENFTLSAFTRSKRRLSNAECSWHKLRSGKLEPDDKRKSPIMYTMMSWTVR